jgi:hypothetical protein
MTVARLSFDHIDRLGGIDQPFWEALHGVGCNEVYRRYGETGCGQPPHRQILVDGEIAQCSVRELDDPPAPLAGNRERQPIAGDRILQLDTGEGVSQRVIHSEVGGAFECAVVRRLRVGMDRHRTGKIATEANQQGEVADVASAHLPDDLKPEGTFGEQVCEPGGYAYPGAADGSGIVLEDLAKGAVRGIREVVFVAELGAAAGIADLSDSSTM